MVLRPERPIFRAAYHHKCHARHIAAVFQNGQEEEKQGDDDRKEALFGTPGTPLKITVNHKGMACGIDAPCFSWRCPRARSVSIRTSSTLCSDAPRSWKVRKKTAAIILAKTWQSRIFSVSTFVNFCARTCSRLSFLVLPRSHGRLFPIKLKRISAIAATRLSGRAPSHRPDDMLEHLFLVFHRPAAPGSAHRPRSLLAANRTGISALAA